MSRKNGTVFQFNTNGGSGADAKRMVRTVLGSGCSVEGKLICSGPSRLDGNVKGILVADELLVIDKNSSVIADLNVQELVVRGQVRGNIRASKRVTLEDSAKVEGDIETPSITITDGAEVIGKIEVTRREKEADSVVKDFAAARGEARAEAHA
jgi:cytoskeletal protein CcmA (bactofilin family)